MLDGSPPQTEAGERNLYREVERVLLVLFKRFLGKRQSGDAGEAASEPLEQLIASAQQGDLKLRNELITDYQPFIVKITSRFCRRYIDPSRDEEFSIALDGFNEAINKFSPVSGRSFLGFAETVIRRRLIDYVRKERKFQMQVPYSSFEVEDEENQVVNPIDYHESIRQYEARCDAEERRLEIAQLSDEMSRFGISFSDLVSVSPKHADSRQMLFMVARMIADSASLMQQLMDNGQLPIKQLLEVVDISRKTVERNRKYLIAAALIFKGNYPYLKGYLHIEATSMERSGAHE